MSVPHAGLFTPTSTDGQRKLFPLSLFLLRAKMMNINVTVTTVNWHTGAKWPKGSVQSNCHLAVIILGGDHLASQRASYLLSPA